jgi:oligosaccharide repeat unit polymerase
VNKFLAGALAVAVGALLVVLFESYHDTMMIQVVALIVASVSVMIFGVVSGRDPRLSLLNEPYALMTVFLAQFFVVGPIGMLLFGSFDNPYFFSFGPERTLQALSAFLVLVVMSVVGHRSHLGDVIADAIPEFGPSPRKLPGNWIIIALLVAAIAGCLYWIVFQGGLMAKLNMGYGTRRGGGAMFRIAYVGLQVGTVLLAWRTIAGKRRRTGDLVLLVGVVTFQCLYFGLITGVRKYLFFLFFALLAVRLLRLGRAALPRFRVAVALTLLLAFFSAWGAIRARPLTALMGAAPTSMYNKQKGMEEGYVSSVAGPFSMACLVFELFPDQEPFRHGQTLMVTLLGFIPRAVWPEKPVGIGKELTRYVVGPFYEETEGFSVAVTLPGDFYLNFGWFGVILGGFSLGLACRAIKRYATRGMVEGRQYRAARVLIPAVYIMGLGEVRGDMSTSLATYILSFIPLLFALTFFNFDEVDPNEITPSTSAST